MLQTALLVLSLSATGDVNMALTTAEHAAQCEQHRAMVTAVMANAGRQVLAAACGSTELALTPFRHGAKPEEMVHRWRISLPRQGGYALTPLADGAACQPAAQADPAVYCARSAQTLARRSE